MKNLLGDSNKGTTPGSAGKGRDKGRDSAALMEALKADNASAKEDTDNFRKKLFEEMSISRTEREKREQKRERNQQQYRDNQQQHRDKSLAILEDSLDQQKK